MQSSLHRHLPASRLFRVSLSPAAAFLLFSAEVAALRAASARTLRSQQKGRAERNHEELRRILPKGKTNFDRLTGRDMAACMSHVNSYMRGSMGWASPMDLASALFPKGLLDAYGIESIEPGEVNLTPSLVPHAMTQL